MLNIRKSSIPRGGMSGNALLAAVALFLVVADNRTFIAQILDAYPPDGSNAVNLLSLLLAYFGLNALALALVAFGRTTKPVLLLLLPIASLVACFMDSYGVAINSEMLRNVAETNLAEARDLLTWRLLFYFVLLGLLPAWLVWRVPLRWRGWRREIASRLVFIAALSAAVGLTVVASGSFYASFLREHKAVRAYANPGSVLASAFKYAGQKRNAPVDGPPEIVAADAHISPSDRDRELFILVVGETARADHFALNGYPRDTNPRLREAGVLSFTNFWACGTSTAVSVPCMFSLTGMAGFDPKTAGRRENLLDVLQRAGVNVLWIDNNSDSKGVALRVPYLNYRSDKLNTVCDSECRDEGMLVSLQDYIDSHPHGDIFIVLHQMGNHGPAYYKRYPEGFEKFTPACRSNDLSRCTQEEIVNAYDNAILYTDDFLGKTIRLLKRNDGTFETALFYLSDHGESLGENGAYLHGLPRAIAPDSQLHVPGIFWLGGSNEDIDLPALQRKRDQRFTHDNLFHTVLGFFEIETSSYRPDLDLAEGCRKPE